MPSLLKSVANRRGNVNRVEPVSNTKIAITGMALNFPGSGKDVDLLWKNLMEGMNFSRRVTDRLHFDETFENVYSNHIHVIDRIEYFDNDFFNISKVEAKTMDPQHRLALETAYETLHDAGYDKETLSGKRFGVFVGQCANDWGCDRHDESAYNATSTARSITANHISYCLGLTGPSLSIDTACSSSLVSVNSGVQSLRANECEAALVGGVHLNLSYYPYTMLCASRMLSPEGVCKTFDASANGYARGDGVAFILCKRLSDAIKHKDSILGTIEGIGANQDGKSANLTAPNTSAQIEVYKQVLKDAKINPKQIGFVATHGTGTTLGDPIEVKSITEVYGIESRTKPLYLGAIKSNIGHLEGTAGIANLVYGLLVLRHQQIPPIYNLQKLNPLVGEAIENKKIIIPSSPILEVTDPIEYVAASSFGFGGTNCHVVLRKYDDKIVKEKKQEHVWNHNYFPLVEEAKSIFTPTETKNLGEGSCEFIQKWTPEIKKYLSGHRVGTTSLVPATCYMEMLRSCVGIVSNTKGFSFINMQFKNMLRLDDDEIPEIKINFNNEKKVFSIFSSVEHAELELDVTYDEKEMDIPKFQTIQNILKDPTHKTMDSDSFYKRTGNDYRGDFKTVEKIWYNDHEMLVKINLANSTTGHKHLRLCSVGDTAIHPGILFLDHQRLPFYAESCEQYIVHSDKIEPIMYGYNVKNGDVVSSYIYTENGEFVSGMINGKTELGLKKIFGDNCPDTFQTKKFYFEEKPLLANNKSIEKKTYDTIYVVENGEEFYKDILRKKNEILKKSSILFVDLNSSDSGLMGFVKTLQKEMPDRKYKYLFAETHKQIQVEKNQMDNFEFVSYENGVRKVGKLGDIEKDVYFVNQQYDLFTQSYTSCFRPFPQKGELEVKVFSVCDGYAFGMISRIPSVGEERWKIGESVAVKWKKNIINQYMLFDEEEINRKTGAFTGSFPFTQPKLSGHYIITGGTGALGKHVANYLASSGVKKITLVSRSGKKVPGGLEHICSIINCDLGIEKNVASLLSDPTITGIVHCAGVLKDGFFANQTEEAYDEVYGKARMAQWLDRYSRSLKLECFVFYSSTSSLLGSAGQSNYSTANCAMDRLIEKRNNLGLLGTSIQWNGWNIGGMVEERTRLTMERDGYQMIDADIGDAQLNSKIIQHGVWGCVPLLPKKVKVPDVIDIIAFSTKEAIEKKVENIIYQLTGNTVDNPDQSLMDSGFDSLSAVELKNELQKSFGVKVASTVLFDYPTSQSLIDYLWGKINKKLVPETNTDNFTTPNDKKTIALISMAFNFPGCGNDEELFWNNLLEKRNFSRKITERINFNQSYDQVYTNHGHTIDNLEYFDNVFFGYTVKEAEIMDPQHKLSLETAYETLHKAGYEKSQIKNKSIGVFVGQMMNDWSRIVENNKSPYTVTSAAPFLTSNRISYTLDLVGPSLTVDTACSSSLVALNCGVQSLQSGECDIALVGGVNAIISFDVYKQLCQANMLSVDGLCKTFDASANGYARGEGCAFVLCKPLLNAEQDGNTILGTIEGIGINQDGKSALITAPNGPSQEKNYTDVLNKAGVDPTEVGFIATHGTGTPLGDPMEVQGIANVYGMDRKSPLYLGALKANIGHTEGTAGIANLIYSLLVLRHQTIPPICGLETINPLVVEAIDGNEESIIFPTQTIKLEENKSIEYVAATSFGLGGTNAHCLVKKYEHKVAKSRNYEKLSLFNKRKFSVFPSETTSFHYQLTQVSNVLESNILGTIDDDYCLVSDTIESYDEVVPNVIFVANNENVQLLLDLFKKVKMHQKIYVYNHHQNLNGAKGLIFAYCQDFPNNFGSYIEFEDLEMPFPFHELKNKNPDFWVVYDSKRKRFVVSIEKIKTLSDEEEERSPHPTIYDGIKDTALITGATGGIGTEITKHLYRQGVRNFIIITRSSIFSPSILSTIPEAQIDYHHVDLTSEEAVKNIFVNYKNITGIYHCAGVETKDTYDKVDLKNYTSKTKGGFLLHKYSHKKSTKEFWLCSSMASLTGVPSQYGYCYGNAYLDALAKIRKHQNLPVSLLHIGPVRGKGMAEKHVEVHDLLGLISVPVEIVVNSFHDKNIDIVCGFKENFGQHMFRHASLLKYVLLLASDDEIVKGGVCEFTTKEDIEKEVLRIVEDLTGERIDLDESFMDSGIDSLLAVEFRNNLQNSFCLPMSGTVLFDHPTVIDLVKLIITEVNKSLSDYTVTYEVLEENSETICIDKLIVERTGFGKVEYLGMIEFAKTERFPELLQTDLVIGKESIELQNGSKFKQMGSELNNDCLVTLYRYMEPLPTFSYFDQTSKKTIEGMKKRLRKYISRNNHHQQLLEYEPSSGRIKLHQEKIM